MANPRSGQLRQASRLAHSVIYSLRYHLPSPACRGSARKSFGTNLNRSERGGDAAGPSLERARHPPSKLAGRHDVALYEERLAAPALGHVYRQKFLEPVRRQFGVTHRVLDVVAEPCL